MALNIFKLLPSIDPLGGLVFLFFIAIMLLVIYLVKKTQTIALLQGETSRLKKIIEDLDQQAKLIIKSDMEVKVYQQEIDSELNKLTLIRDLILSSIHILDKETLFTQINEKVINTLGFRKALILDYNTLAVKININFNPQEIEAIKNTFQYKKEALRDVQLLRKDSEVYKQLAPTLQLADTLIAPVKIKEIVYAIFIISELLMPTELKKSQREAFIIICMYLNQCLDNIRLFEDLYHTKDDLERKIKERTNELVRSLREIEIISKAKSDFISSVSHELRTPLTSVKGFSSLLVEDKFGKLPDEAKKRLIKIDDNVNKLMDIVNTLLDISRIESGKMEIRIAVFELVKLIKDVTDFLTPQIESKKIRLAFDLPESLNVYIDKNLIERVLINIINNAIKFTPEGGKIKIGCKKDANQAVISISDTGCGLSKEDLGKLFQEFFRANNPINNEIIGTGLGLSLVKRIIDTHKEKIWVESELDKGTTFYFTLKITDTRGNPSSE